ncbi:class I SAM-dependent methyltransferase [Dyella agri]|uniref:class I SAM-dependent methyltransferase n=1 Tax=Dyella agri TaxID=1926869 RepID=UPI00384FA92B
MNLPFAGLDGFARHRPGLASHLALFEIDPPGTQAWKRSCLAGLGMAEPGWLCFVPIDFEAGERWADRLAAAGFDAICTAVIACIDVSRYLGYDRPCRRHACAFVDPLRRRSSPAWAPHDAASLPTGETRCDSFR